MVLNSGPATTQSTVNSPVLSRQVVMAVANATDCSQDELPPLNEAIDPEALDRLFASTLGQKRRTDGRVVFEYAGFEIDVHSSDGITVRPVEP
jgi:hypothetical protein